LKFDGAPAVELNQCSSAFSFRVLDFENNPIATTATVRITAGDGLVYTAPSCLASLPASGADSLYSLANASTGSFSVYPSSAGQITLAISIDGSLILGDSISFNVGTSSVVTQVTVTAGAGFSATAGSCAPVALRVNAANSNGETINTQNAIAFSIRFNAGSGVIGTACANAGQATLVSSIVAVSSSREVYVTPSAAGWASVEASPLGALQSGSFGFNVGAGTANDYTIEISGQTHLFAGATSYYMIKLLDGAGQAAAAPQDIDIVVSAGAAYRGKMSAGFSALQTTTEVTVRIQQGTSLAVVGLRPSAGVSQDFDLTATSTYSSTPLHITVD
jgi:hypothetical protein